MGEAAAEIVKDALCPTVNAVALALKNTAGVLKAFVALRSLECCARGTRGAGLSADVVTGAVAPASVPETPVATTDTKPTNRHIHAFGVALRIDLLMIHNLPIAPTFHYPLNRYPTPRLVPELRTRHISGGRGRR